ncbi:hypothetical protein ACVQ8P_03975 [Dellaglioa sp. BT-FLS60]
MSENNNKQPTENNVPQHREAIVINNQSTNQTNPLGTAGFVIALITLFLGWIPVIGWIMWILGALFSVIGLFKTPKGFAIAGTIISFIDVFVILAIASGIAAAGAMF